LLNSKDVSVFLACSELCQKIKEKVLSELFECDALNKIVEKNKNQKASAEFLGSKVPTEFGEIKTLELINGIISEKLKELKRKEEAVKLKELKKSKEIERMKQIKLKKSRGKNFLI
jgi:hypothetical protein